MVRQNHKKKGRKIGRDKDKCARYRARGTREKNKARRAAKIARQAAKKAAHRVSTDAQRSSGAMEGAHHDGEERTNAPGNFTG